jgi:hypothetical protein
MIASLLMYHFYQGSPDWEKKIELWQFFGGMNPISLHEKIMIQWSGSILLFSPNLLQKSDIFKKT